jgi:oxygen-dependent protoporphyrinogen oxidase
MEDQELSFRRRVEPAHRVVVVGGGIAGLTAAFYLNKCGYDVRVFESSDRIGGMIQTSWRENKYLIEHGPNAYLSTSEQIKSLSRELSLEQLEVCNNSRDRFIFWDGSLRSLPKSPMSLLGTKLLSAAGKARLIAEPLIRSKSFDGETIASFVRRRAGIEVLETLADPFVSGVWAGNPEELELRATLPKVYELEQNYGSVMRGLAKERGKLGKHDILSYRWGMGTLPARLEEVLKRRIRLNTNILSVSHDNQDRLFAHCGDVERRFEADAIVVATDPHTAADLIDTASTHAASELSEIEFCSLAVVHTAYAKSDVGFRPHGYGFLVPRITNVRILGTMYSSALFDHRAPQDEVLLTTFIGGSSDPDAIGLDDDELLKEVRKGLHVTMGINSKPSFTKIIRLKKAIPQYKVGHGQRIARIKHELEKVPGLFLTGNYFSGISVSDTIGHARQTAETVRDFFRKPRVRKYYLPHGD